jgi:hypothetical protein
MKTSIAGCRCQAPWAQQRWTSGHVHGRSLNTCLREPRGADRSRSGDPEHPLRGAGSRGGTRGPSRCSSGSRKGYPGSRSPADLSSRCTTCNCSTAPWPRPPAAPESRSPTWTPDDVSSGCRGLAGQIPRCKQIRIAWRDPYLRWVLSLRGVRSFRVDRRRAKSGGAERLLVEPEDALGVHVRHSGLVSGSQRCSSDELDRFFC